MATRKIKTPGEATEAPEVITEQAQQPQAPEAATSGLPRASDIDPTKITRSVLTQDGWVCPG